MRWGILGRKKSKENITKIKKHNGGLITEVNTGFFCGGGVTGEIKPASICEASRQLKI